MANSKMTPSVIKTSIVPLVGAKEALADRNFYITDNISFFELHFSLDLTSTGITADAPLFDLPAVASAKNIQYGYGIGYSSGTSTIHLIYNIGNKLYLDGNAVSAFSNGVFAGTFRMSLI